MMKNIRSQKNTNRGFTLVELIVVLVILAILAGILVPMLLGWIDRAKLKQDMLDAKNCMTAAQAEFSSAYAQRPSDTEGWFSVLPPAEVPHFEGRSENNICNNDIYLYKCYSNKTFFDPDGTERKLTAYSPFAERILKTAGYDSEDSYPYYFIVATGHYEKYIKDDPHKPYTVVFAMYQEKENSKPIFFDGTKWQKEYPRDMLKDGNDKKFNYYTINGERMRLQYYLISNKEKSGSWYDTLSKNSKQ